MLEKRDRKRYPKRIKIRFGIEAPTRMAFTEDISEGGIFLKLSASQIPKEVLKIEMEIPGGEPVVLEGQARWAKRVSPAVVHKCSKAGIGIAIKRFVSGEERYRELIASLRREREQSKTLRPPQQIQDLNE